MLYEYGVRWCQHTALGVVLSHWYFLPYASLCLFHMISVCTLYFQTKQDLVSGPGSYCGVFCWCFTWPSIVARFTILTFAVGGTLISMVVVGFLINATCHVHGVCSAPCLQDSLVRRLRINMQQPCQKKNPNQSKSCHFSCHHSYNFRMFITNRQAATAFQVRTAFTYAALISAVDPVAAGTRHFCHGKSPFLIGKPSINGPFSMAMLNSQMVNF